MVRVFYAYRAKGRLVPSVTRGESRAEVVSRLASEGIDPRLICEPFGDRESIAACLDMTRDALAVLPAANAWARAELTRTVVALEEELADWDAAVPAVT